MVRLPIAVLLERPKPTNVAKPTKNTPWNAEWEDQGCDRKSPHRGLRAPFIAQSGNLCFAQS
jgi:hypothetical protein